MNTIWMVRDPLQENTIYLEKRPQVRKYMLENKHHNQIEVEEIQWNYKSELIKIINSAYSRGAVDGIRLCSSA